MIKLSNLTLKNFLSHVDTDLHLNEYEGLVLIEGQTTDGHYSSNGSGKSTLLEGIVYALTGDTLRGVSVNDVVNRNHKKNTQVSLDFFKEDTSYKVSRYRKDDINGDSLVLFKGEENISKRVNKETQKSLDNILGISYKVLVSTILLGEGLSSRFTQLSDAEKKSLIESTLNLNYDMNKLRDKANEILKNLKLDIARLDGEISVLESYENTDLESIKNSISDNKNCISIYVSTSDHIKEEYERLSSEIENINPKIQLINDTINKFNNLSRQYSEISSMNSHYAEERDKVSQGESPVCTMCHQVLQSVESKQSVINSYQEKIDENLKLLSTIEEEINKLPDINLMKMKSESLAKEYTEKSNKYKELMQDYNSYQVKIAEAQKDIVSLTSIIDNIAEHHNQLEEKKIERDKTILDKNKYEYFYKLFSPTGIIVNILSDAIDYINNRLSTYSSILLEKDYHINFVKGKISLVDSSGASYQSLSNGEKRRLDISIQFALHDYVHTYCGMEVDCCFIDEILDTLDDIGVENIFEVLRLKLDYCQLKSIYVITHNNALKDKFDKVITVKKDSSGDSYLA
jgi:DNA repair exonuclease SbcCD ATPase subunit